MESPFRATYAAAAIAGAFVLFVFFVWHWFNIAPVWSVLVEGAAGVALAALAIAWAWRDARRAGRFASRAGGLAFGAVFVGGLLVGEIVGLARGPRPDPEPGIEILYALPPAMIPAAAVALAGVWVVRAPRGAASFGLASLLLIVWLGGAIVQRGGIGQGLELLVLLAPTYLAAGGLLHVLERRFSGTRVQRMSA